MKQVNTGGLPFNRMRDNDKYYVDKSLLIADILDTGDHGVYLFTRPRRFGKTTNITMLDAFFNIRYQGNTWFDDLEISKTDRYARYKNAFPVIHIDLKDLSCASMADFTGDLIVAVNNAINPFSEVLDGIALSDYERGLLSDVFSRKVSASDLKASIAIMCGILKRHYGKGVIVLIDEYDRAVTDSFGTEIQSDIMAMLGGFLSSTLKSNPALQMAYVTGVMKVAKSGMFSGLNNMKVNDIFSASSDERFGFTESEVRAITEYYGHPESFDEAKEWNDEYRFGNAEIYNPWSVLSYVKLGFVPGTYWAGTSGNSIVPDLVDRADRETRESLRILAEGGSIRWPVEPMVTFADLGVDGGAIWSVMVMSGYLRAEAEDTGHAISIPNKEMFGVFAKAVTAHLGGKADSYVRAFADAVLSGDAGRMQRELYGIMAESVSVRLLRYEIPYQTLILGLLMHLAGRYRITGDFESGRGYHDIRLESRFGDGPNIVMEIKVRRTSSAEAQARKALEQIREKDYMHGLKGETILYGICFDKKVPVIESERISGSRTIIGVRGPARP